MEELYLGCHVSFHKQTQLLGSVKEALSYGANTFMFYISSPQNTTRYPIDLENQKEAITFMKTHKIDPSKVVVHAPYIINLATLKNREFMINFLKEECKRVQAYGMTKLVLHPGSHVGLGKQKGIQNIIEALNEVLKEPTSVVILLETMAGKGTEIGTIEEVIEIIKNVEKKENIGICLDTCHLHDAGYSLTDFSSVLNLIETSIGLEKIGCIHVNDSKNEKGSHKDRHENFGFGTIGFSVLEEIVYHPKLKNVPKILETPYVSVNDEEKKRSFPPYKFEIEMIKKKKKNQNLIEDIRKFYTS